MAGAPKRVGELLMAKGLINENQLEEALVEQRSTGALIGAVLVGKGWITEEMLLQTLAEQFGIRFMHLDFAAIDWTLAMKFPPSLMVEHGCLPIRMDGVSVTVAIANPLEAWGVSKVERAVAGRKVELVLVPNGELREAIQQQHRLAAKKIQASLETEES